MQAGLGITYKVECEYCAQEKAQARSPETKFLMKKNEQSVPYTCCVDCAAKIDKLNAPFIKKIEIQEEKLKAKVKAQREKEAKEKKEQADNSPSAEDATAKALGQIATVLTSLVGRMEDLENKINDKGTTRKTRSK